MVIALGVGGDADDVWTVNMTDFLQHTGVAGIGFLLYRNSGVTRVHSLI